MQSVEQAALNLNLQIHIDSAASSEQIEHIFKKPGKEDLPAEAERDEESEE